MSMPSGSGPPQISPAPPVDLTPTDDEPPTKKIRSEDNLVPEVEFISLHKVNNFTLFRNSIENNLCIFTEPCNYSGSSSKL